MPALGTCIGMVRWQLVPFVGERAKYAVVFLHHVAGEPEKILLVL